MIITLDGPAGSGKSTVARLLAERLGYRELDTGAMYRAVALCALEDREDPEYAAVSGAWRHYLDDPEIRSERVNARVSEIAQLPGVRGALHDAQRAILAEGDAVAEGRDIGEVVWPEAELKVWLDADPSVRAARRSAERDDATAGAAILERDRRDAAQTVVPGDAVVVDTTALTLDQVVDRIVELAVERGLVKR